MPLRDETIRRFLTAIDMDSVVFLCGAGLSIPPPSDLYSSTAVSQACYDARIPIEKLDPVLRDDVDALAGHFLATGAFDVFIDLVPWGELVGTPNEGHASVADLLICRGARAALSTNFDSLIEQWAAEHKVAMRGALTGQEAVLFSRVTSPLIKLHGCMQRAPEHTLWTRGQLAIARIASDISSCSEWMRQNLPGKDLFVVGFWTDWGYLNKVLEEALTIKNARSVTVIDSSSEAVLRGKAPILWEKLTTLSNTFEHVEASSDDALRELRNAFASTWLKKFYALGERLILANGEVTPPDLQIDSLVGEDLYNSRRDAEGVPYNRAALQKAPPETAAQAAFLHLRMLNAGATRRGAWLDHRGRSYRIINGAGRGLEEVREKYKESPATEQPEIIVCAGATELGTPARQIESGRGASTVRPAPGGGATWLTLEQALRELQA